MVGELITLPLRVGVRATRLWLRVAEETFAVARHTTERLIGSGSSSGSYGGDREDWAVPSPPRPGLPAPAGYAPPTEAPGRPPGPHPVPPAPRPPPPPRVTPRPPAPEPPSPIEPEPPHVSEQAELVEELAEPGAEDGAGAEVRVEPPWDGYDQMNAKQVIARLSSASTAELAAVKLYESGSRGRQTILNAVERELRGANGRSSRS